MPRTCTVCQHEDVAGINSALLAGTPLRTIADLNGLSHQSLIRHRDNHLPGSLLKSQEAREIADADRLMAELEATFARVNKLFDACDEWLTDPDDPTRYDIGPRAGELMVTYEERSNGRTVQR